MIKEQELHIVPTQEKWPPNLNLVSSKEGPIFLYDNMHRNSDTDSFHHPILDGVDSSVEGGSWFIYFLL